MIPASSRGVGWTSVGVERRNRGPECSQDQEMLGAGSQPRMEEQMHPLKVSHSARLWGDRWLEPADTARRG